MDSSQIKRIDDAIKAWAAANESSIREFKFENYPFGHRYAIIPRNRKASGIWLTIHENSPVCDFDLG